MPLNPNVPVPRTPFVDSRGILTNPGLYFLYQVISAAEGVDEIQAELGVLDAELVAVEARLTTAEGEVDTLQAQIAAIQASATSLAARVTALEEAALNFLVADDPPKLKDPRIDALEVLSWAS